MKVSPSQERPEAWSPSQSPKGQSPRDHAPRLAPPERPVRQRKKGPLWVVYYVCRRLASSPVFSTITMVLTIYALFGDDFRLLLTDKPADFIFDWITMASMAIFATEVIVCSIGKAEYLLGFFFWLDILSTMTLVLDITFVAEGLFGDAISSGLASAAAGRSGASEDSAEAARAARMSRAGTKAGRVVRLIRVVRLLRLVKVFNSKKSESHLEQRVPGEFCEDDDWELNLSKESEVSQKLSEMTTRRVIILVLAIMLALPCFQPDLWVETLPNSAEYGGGIIFKRFQRDIRTYEPGSNASATEAYLNSANRRIYVDDFYSFLYFHNPFCSEVPDNSATSPLSSFAEVFWVGAGGEFVLQGNPVMDFMLPRYFGRAHGDLNARWAGERWPSYQCELTDDPVGLMDVPWREAQECISGVVRGLSLIRGEGVVCPEQLRYQERWVVQPVAPLWMSDEDVKKLFWIYVFDRRRGSQWEALLNTARTIFICLLLGFGAMIFSRDASKLVLTPIERMIGKLNRIRNNPLEAIAMTDHERQMEQVDEMKHQDTDKVVATTSDRLWQERLAGRSSKWTRHARKWLGKLRPAASEDGSGGPEPMETVVLEKTIIKIGSLLALGFGEAGAEVIGQNMKGGDNSALNAMIPGRRVDCIFGFCNIRNFTDATEVLQDQVMVFVNRIASVVHSCVSEFFGSPNKNMGDAFLLAWRLTGHSPLKRQRLADMALVSIVKIIAQTNRSPLLAQCRNHPKLVKRLPNYHVRMGFGLHSGWAIEGAIGSEFKIDASYLSPNVNMAARLEAMTKSFGCLVLLSQSLINLMSESLADECRLIDHVKLVGSRDEAFKLYTVDLDDMALEEGQLDIKETGTSGLMEVDLNQVQIKHGSKAEFRARFERQERKKERWQDDYDMQLLFETDPDIQTMRSKFTVEYFCRFKMAYLNYEAGEWGVAKEMLDASRFYLGTEDGPSVALLRYMRSYNWVAPKTWPGFRTLTEQQLDDMAQEDTKEAAFDVPDLDTAGSLPPQG